MHKKTVTIGPFDFESKREFEAHAQKILHRYDLRQRIGGEDGEFLKHLFLQHPDHREELNGHGIVGFDIRRHKFGTRSFHVIRADGAAVDFSFQKCA